MVRLVSLFGIAFVTLAAVALLAPGEKPVRQPQPEPDRNDDASPTLSRQSHRVIPAYAAGFSLN
jgi:hypothetical protein